MALATNDKVGALVPPSRVLTTAEVLELAAPTLEANEEFFRVHGADLDDDFDEALEEDACEEPDGVSDFGDTDDPDNASGDDGDQGEGEDDLGLDVVASFFQEAKDGLDNVIDDTAQHLGVSREDAIALIDELDVCYATKAEEMLEGGEGKTRRVVYDLRQIGKGSLESQRLAASVLARFAYDLRGITAPAGSRAEGILRKL